MNATGSRAALLCLSLSIALLTVACGRESGLVGQEVTRVSPTNIPDAVRAATEGTGPTAVPSAPPSATLPAATDAAASAPPSEGSTDPALDPGQVEKGAALFSQFACMSCHSVSGQPMTGPPLNGIYGHEVALTDGQNVVIDDEYLKRAILEPDAQVVDGYPTGLMSAVVGAYQDQLQKEDTLQPLVVYIKSLK